MDKDQQVQKRFLKEQVEWCEMQDIVLEKIENKLYQMKKLAEYVRDYEPTSIQVNRLNARLNILKQEVHSLEQQLQSYVH